MKELIDILTSEDKSFDGLPMWVYMFAIPAGLVLMCMIGEALS
jgi:TRAP-type C4-dicarboxylate transport system permease small subunit